MKVICKDKWSYLLQSQVVVLYHSERRERERKEGGREGRKHLRRKRQSTRVKEVFVHSLTLLESVSSPGSSHKADVESLLAAAQTERVQRLLCMPGRDLLPQISTRSQKRDRCS